MPELNHGSRLSRFCVTVGGMLAIVLAAEWFTGEFSAASYDNVVRSPQGGYAYVPNVRGAYRSIESNKLFRLETNALGARDQAWPREEGAFTIDIVGNSFVDATGVAVRERFSAVLQQTLRTAGMPARVRNFGVQGQSLINHVDRALMAENDHKPDLVVLALTASTDFQSAPQTTFRGEHRITFSVTPGGVTRDEAPLTSAEQTIRQVRSMVRNLWLGRITHQVVLQTEQWMRGGLGGGGPACPVSVTPDAAARKPGFDLTEAILADLQTRLGPRLLVILIPAEEQLHRPAGLACDWDAPNRWLRDYATRSGLRVIDLLPLLDAKAAPQFFPHGHLNQNGHRTVAEALAVALGHPGTGR